MLKQDLYTITENRRIANGIFGMTLLGAHGFTKPGQFANIKLDGLYLRRPISVCDFDENGFSLIYKTVGRGTELMSELREGTSLDILTGLGNGYAIENSGKKPLLIAGGSGVPPMYKLAESLINEGREVTAILGFNSKEDVYLEDELKALGVRVRITTVDGSYADKGFVTDAMTDELDYSFFYTCGPLPMYKAIRKVVKTEGQYSFEERMGCGFGACMGCSMKTRSGGKRICKDGPVFDSTEIIWGEEL
ncbi:MAG: dihydroorotate dehydrogenase electron transfer subunit [Clostridia bacterium]|nr:dihydroorotate dehydrogenase electron transfer subunit [Clostridia bacterium]